MDILEKGRKLKSVKQLNLIITGRSRSELKCVRMVKLA